MKAISKLKWYEFERLVFSAQKFVKINVPETSKVSVF